MPDEIQIEKTPTTPPKPEHPIKPSSKESIKSPEQAEQETSKKTQPTLEEPTIPTEEELSKKGKDGTERKKSTTELQLKEIESTLAKDLEEFYNSLNDQEKIKFKSSGEQAATEILQILKNPQSNSSPIFKIFRIITNLINSSDQQDIIHKSQSKKIIKIIKTWLGATSSNKQYIEQAAIVKTGELINLLRTFE